VAKAYGQLGILPDTSVIVHCPTGHQASQTWFLLKHVLGYADVKWYDASWSHWAARADLPEASEENNKKNKMRATTLSAF